MEKKKLLSIGGRLIFEAAVETTLSLVLAALADGADLRGADLYGANLYGADLRGADLRGANLYGADLPSPTMVLMANWFEVSVDLCRDLMNYDAACHPNVQKFTEWAAGGVCPYSDEKVERAALFKEDKRLYDPTAPACRPYDLMRRLLEEKCPEWTDEQTKEFEERFKK
jgi:hypothetical protein